MKILVYGINYSPELTGTGKYTGEMCEWFAEQGHDVKVVTAPPYYPDWKVQNPYSSFLFKKENISDVTVYRCPLFVPKKITTISRIFHLLSFSLSSAFALCRQLFWRPDVIICVVPTLFCGMNSIIYGKLTGAKTIIHIQDYEVDALFGLKMDGKMGVLKKLASSIERKILRGFNRVSTISVCMMRKALDKGVTKEKVLFFPNWSKLECFKNAKVKKDFRQILKIPEGNKVVLYSGNIGEKQGLSDVVLAAKRLQDRNISFVISGEGAGKPKIKKLIQDNKLKNIILGGLVSFEDLPSLLLMADCHLVVQKRGAADAVLPSKLTNIFAIGGQALITADAHTELGVLCHNNPDIATCVAPENIDELINGIELVLQKNKRNKFAEQYAQEHLDKNSILSNFEVDLRKLIYG